MKYTPILAALLLSGCMSSETSSTAATAPAATGVELRGDAFVENVVGAAFQCKNQAVSFEFTVPAGDGPDYPFSAKGPQVDVDGVYAIAADGAVSRKDTGETMRWTLREDGTIEALNNGTGSLSVCTRSA